MSMEHEKALLSKGLIDFAKAIQALSWWELAKVSEYLASDFPHLVKSDRMDRDGIAELLHEMSASIVKEADNLPMPGERKSA